MIAIHRKHIFAILGSALVIGLLLPTYLALRPKAPPPKSVRQEGVIPPLFPEGAEPAPDRQAGSLKVTSEPAGAQVQIRYGDQTIQQITPFELNDIRFVGEEVELAIRATKEGYQSEERFLLLTSETPRREIALVLGGTGNALLNVQALPWGKIGIDQKGNLRDSPVVRQTLKPGNHTVWVYHPPTQEWLQASFEAAPSQQIRCVADFSKEATLSCL